MKKVIKECWQKYDREKKETNLVSKEEYEENVFPLLEEKIKNIRAFENHEALMGAIEYTTTAEEMFLASPEELERIKANILTEYQSNCLENIEFETGYHYCCWVEMEFEN